MEAGWIMDSNFLRQKVLNLDQFSHKKQLHRLALGIKHKQKLLSKVLLMSANLMQNCKLQWHLDLCLWQLQPIQCGNSRPQASSHLPNALMAN